MAGKHVGNDVQVGALSHPHVYPGDRLNKAFAEGWQANEYDDNPHTAGTPEFNAWAKGVAAANAYEAGPAGTTKTPDSL